MREGLIKLKKWASHPALRIEAAPSRHQSHMLGGVGINVANCYGGGARSIEESLAESSQGFIRKTKLIRGAQTYILQDFW